MEFSKSWQVFKQLQLRKREEEMIGIQNRIMAMQYIKKNFKGKKKSSIKLAIILSYNHDITMINVTMIHHNFSGVSSESDFCAGIAHAQM